MNTEAPASEFGHIIGARYGDAGRVQPEAQAETRHSGLRGPAQPTASPVRQRLLHLEAVGVSSTRLGELLSWRGPESGVRCPADLCQRPEGWGPRLVRFFGRWHRIGRGHVSTARHPIRRNW